jgi:uncharacterized protein (DUF1330 family)
LRGYLIFDLEITDQEAWEEYRRVAGPLMIAAGGRFIVRGEKAEALEGGWQPATVSVVEFPSYETARDFYYSPAYAATLPLRQKASRGRGILVGSTPLPEASR